MELHPELFKMEHYFKEGVFLTVPFDPHDVKYYSSALRTWLEHIQVPKGVRKDIRKEEDVVYDERGGERIAKVKVTYFQTHRDFSCGKENK